MKAAAARGRQTYSFDEAMKLPAQEPEPDSALGAFLKGAKHDSGPALAGLAAIPAGAAVGEAVFPWLGPVGPIVGGAVAERGRAPGPRKRGLAAPPVARQTGGAPNVRLPIPIAAFRAQGRLGQLSATSGLARCSKTTSTIVALIGQPGGCRPPIARQ
jgi:hypothetical protein